MKKLYFLITLILIYGCANSKTVYWCGDHPCINNKEKQAYFKKTMTVEVKNIEKTKEKKAEIEKIIQEARLNEKKRLKQEKTFAKKLKLQKKEKINEKKRLLKKAKIEEKMKLKKIKEEKKLAKKIEKANKTRSKHIDTKNIRKIDKDHFQSLVEEITQKNILRPYPDINDIQN
tara:strand:- start:517 stop:1038 length:522 start_codon:yes stop_codon:yes gene_type:complete